MAIAALGMWRRGDGRWGVDGDGSDRSRGINLPLVGEGLIEVELGAGVCAAGPQDQHADRETVLHVVLSAGGTEGDEVKVEPNVHTFRTSQTT